MQYKVILVDQKATLCSTTPITGEIEQAANAMSAEGYELERPINRKTSDA